MGKPSAPTPPDPVATAAAQTGTNISTAIANNAMGMVNQQGPWGTQTNEIRGWQDVYDPTTEQSYRVPQYVTKTTLNQKDQQALSNTRDAKVDLSKTAADQAGFLKNYLGHKVQAPGTDSVRSLPGSAPQYAQMQGNANLNAGPASGGQIARGVADAGGIQKQGPQTGSLAANLQQGDLNRANASGGSIQKDISPQNLQIRDINAPGVKTDVKWIDAKNRAAQGGDITRSYGTDFSQDRQRVEDALMGRINKQNDRDLEQLRTRLANQGIGEGSEAYSAAMDDYNRGLADQRIGAVLAGGQEQSRLTGLEAQRAGFENAAQQQAFGQDFSNIGQQANIAGQQMNMNLARAGFMNNAQAQAYGQDAANLERDNATRQAQFGQNLAAGQFANQAQAQQYGQSAANIDRSNAVQAQDFGQDLARMQALNNVEAQRYNQAMQTAQFGNQAQAQQYAQNLQGGQFANQAQQQAYNQSLGNIQLQNAARQATLDNANQAAMANNQSLGSAFNQQMALANASDARRKQFIEEQFAYRNQPINEITALLSGAQVNAPQFSQFQPTQMPTVDYAGLVNQNYAQQMGNYNAQMGQYNGLMGGLFGLGSAGIMASDIRVKKNIRKIGKRADGLGVYQFDYINGVGPRVSLMAQEVEQVYPDAVFEIGGVKHIDMGAVQ